MTANRYTDLTGKKFSLLTVIGKGARKVYGKDKKEFPSWKCLCDCGNTVEVITHSLKSGKTKSCGCIKSDTARENFSTHGLSGSPEYKIWKALHYRCNNKNSKNYKQYGGRGISICKEWDYHQGGCFKNFIKDMGQRPTEKHTLERIDVDEGYNKINCKWILAKEQPRNKRMLKNNQDTKTTGVYSRKDKEGNITSFYAVWCDSEGRRRSREFSVKRYGRDSALQKAKDARKSGLIELYNQGIIYGNHHWRGLND